MIVSSKNKNDNKKKNNGPIFVERPVPTQEQVKNFERAVLKEVRQEEIDDNLSEIYRDESGNLIDVSRVRSKKDFIFVKFIKKLFVLAVLFCLGYGFYTYFTDQFSNTVSADLTINAPESVKAGEDFNYTIHYKNNSNFELNSLQLEIKYPENFLLNNISGAGLELLATSTAQNSFSLPALPVNSEVDIIISGKLLAEKDSVNLIGVSLSYEPGTFSAKFKKEAVASVRVNDLGFDLDFEYTNAALTGENSQIDIMFSNVKDNFFNDFEISFAFPENISLVDDQISTTTATSSNNGLMISKSSNLIWQVSGLASSTNSYHLPIQYIVNKKIEDNQKIIIRLSKKVNENKTYVFAEKNIELNVMNSNLNLTLILNGSKNDNTANFGETLNYSLVYANKSDSQLKDIVIMAALKSDFLDWTSFKNNQKGTVGESTITWTKEQIPALASLAPGEEGVIDFSINLRPYNNSDLGKSFNVTSYAQFNINNRQADLKDSLSNKIITKVNSDLKLTERVLYFDENNLPVGSGPLPPKVGQKTSLKVYWKIENNLHELNNTRVVTKLPEYVLFDDNANVSSGDLSFDGATHSVIWNIGILPVSTYQAQADFNISVTPTDNQKNSLLVLLSDSTVTAIDTDTGANIEKKGTSKTTKLEDDDIAGLNNSGLVE